MGSGAVAEAPLLVHANGHCLPHRHKSCTMVRDCHGVKQKVNGEAQCVQFLAAGRAIVKNVVAVWMLLLGRCR